MYTLSTYNETLNEKFKSLVGQLSLNITFPARDVTISLSMFQLILTSARQSELYKYLTFFFT